MTEIEQLKINETEWARLSCADLEECHNHLVDLLELVNSKAPDHGKIKSFVIEWDRLFREGERKPPILRLVK